MARFKWLGELQRGSVTFENVKKMRVPTKAGKDELVPIPPATEFVIGADLGYDTTDIRSLRMLRSDARFEEIM